METAIITVDGYEKWGEITVKPRTVADNMLHIPAEVDRLLQGNPQSSNSRVQNSAYAIATAKFAIVEPADLVEQVLRSTDPNDMAFFWAFMREYDTMNQDFLKSAETKKSGRTTGKKSASPSDTTETSSLLTLDG